MKKTIKILNERIDYYTGGEEMKSMSESAGDIRIVRELKYIKERLTDGEKE